MASAEAASAAADVRYAPDDPTLPKPWKGLIGGSSGAIYYWNTETGATQYDKPSSAVDATSRLAPQHGQAEYMNQFSQQQGQYQSPLSGQVAQQQQQQQPATSQIPAVGQQGSEMGAAQQQYAQYGQGMPQRGSQVGQMPMQQRQNVQQPYGSQLVQQMGHQMPPQQGSHMAQQPVQDPSQLVQQAAQHQSPPMGQPQSHHYMPQQMHYAPHQQSMPPQGQPTAQPNAHHMPQGPKFSYPQDGRNGLPQRDDSDFSKIKEPGIDQSGRAVGQSPSFLNSSNHGLQGSPVSAQSQSFGPSGHMHQPSSNVPSLRPM